MPLNADSAAGKAKNEYKSLVLPFDARFRHFEWREGTDKVRPVGRTIRSAEDLAGFCEGKEVSALYVSKHRQLQAKRCARFHEAGNPEDFILLGGDFVLDLDAKNFPSLGRCLWWAKHAYAWLRARSRFAVCDSDVIFSGRGYYLWFYDFWTPSLREGANVKNRVNEYKAELRKAVDMMRSAGFRFSYKPEPNAFDLGPALNPRQVFRVVGSRNHRNGEEVSIIPSLSVRLPQMRMETQGHDEAVLAPSLSSPQMMSSRTVPNKSRAGDRVESETGFLRPPEESPSLANFGVLR